MMVAVHFAVYTKYMYSNVRPSHYNNKPRQHGNTIIMCDCLTVRGWPVIPYTLDRTGMYSMYDTCSQCYSSNVPIRLLDIACHFQLEVLCVKNKFISVSRSPGLTFVCSTSD